MKIEDSFVQGCKDMDNCMDILNWYRNLYYKEENSTEHGIMANAINKMFMRAKSIGVLEKLQGEKE